jgi:hypothetical protein
LFGVLMTEEAREEGFRMTKPGWGAVVLGEPADLEDWTYTLKEPFDPWAEIRGAETVLRSASFDE